MFVILTTARAAFSVFTGYPVVADFYWWIYQADVAIVITTIGNISRRTQAARARGMLDRISGVMKNYSISVIV